MIALGAVLGATLAWAFLDAASVRDQSAERRALENRAAALNAQSLAPGSALGCLNGLAGEEVEAACERALFAAPASVAAATTYAAARLALLADMVAYVKRGGTTIDDALVPLRRSLESDRFGFVAHMLAVRDGCTSENCKALALLHDASRVRANLSGQTLDRYLEHYLTVWAQSPGTPVADATAAAPPNGQAGTPGQRKVVVDIDFPSAASIPPVSIMNPEPKGPPAGESPASARQSRKQSAGAAAPAPPAAPPVDPIWLPGTATTAPVPPPAAANGAPAGAGGPVQLNPFPGPSQAGAGAPRAQ